MAPGACPVAAYAGRLIPALSAAPVGKIALDYGRGYQADQHVEHRPLVRLGAGEDQRAVGGRLVLAAGPEAGPP
jgi:hypothetical protein